MNGLRQVRSRTLILVIVTIALVLGHVLLFHLARRFMSSHVAVSRRLSDFLKKKTPQRGKE